MVAESRIANVAGKGGGPLGSRRGSEAPEKPGNAGGGKDPLTAARISARRRCLQVWTFSTPRFWARHSLPAIIHFRTVSRPA
jgi:hypothetical protein